MLTFSFYEINYQRSSENICYLFSFYEITYQINYRIFRLWNSVFFIKAKLLPSAEVISIYFSLYWPHNEWWILTSNVNCSVMGLLNHRGSSRSTLCIHPVYIGSSSSIKIYYLSPKKKKIAMDHHLSITLMWLCLVAQPQGCSIGYKKKKIHLIRSLCFMHFTLISNQQILSLAIKFSLYVSLEEIVTPDLHIAAKAGGATKF